MTGIEICLIVIGIACICASFFVSRKAASQEVSDSYGGSHSSAEVWTEKDEQMVKQRLEEILQEQQEEYVDEAKDRMGRICNEKIMAVDEFTKQILEKINSNHQEVVFMYNMLNEKQKELKAVMTETVRPVSESGSLAESGAVAARSKASQAAPNAVQDRQPAPKAASVTRVASAPSVVDMPEVDPSIFRTPPTQAGALTGLDQVKKSAPASKKATGVSQSQAKGTGGKEKVRQQSVAMPHPDAMKQEIEENHSQTAEESENVNLQIQKMYKAGQSVLDISKKLDIGQGEVKLVIALYEGKKR